MHNSSGGPANLQDGKPTSPPTPLISHSEKEGSFKLNVDFKLILKFPF